MKRKRKKEPHFDGMIDVTKLTPEQTRELASIIYDAYQKVAAPCPDKK